MGADWFMGWGDGYAPHTLIMRILADAEGYGYEGVFCGTPHR
ncbi:MAG: hypothetical protein PHO36_16325 [Parabacteroides sp.]|nr:hypothetical protein [Parabacteroides sp.]